MKDRPLFSVIIASYNNGRFLAEAIRSIINQTYDAWEVIVVDDASTDQSREVMKEFQQHPNIRSFHHRKNAGAGAAFKTAAFHARGEIIGMLGADDALTPDALESMVEAHLAQPETVLVNSDLVFCNQDLEPTGEPSPYHEKPSGQPFTEGVTVSSFAAFKTAAYRQTSGFAAGFRGAVDHDIYFKLEEWGTVAYIKKQLYLYRQNPIGISQGKNGLRASQYARLAYRNAFARRLFFRSKVRRPLLKQLLVSQHLYHQRYGVGSGSYLKRGFHRLLAAAYEVFIGQHGRNASR
jgi:glycosyltransferase involved in cell wall biosynthesis